MFDLDHWQEILNALGKNRLRTALTAFGVLWGIFMLVIMLGSGTGLRNGVTQDFSGGATNSFFVWARSTSKPYRGLPPGRSLELTNQDTEAIRHGISHADVVAPRIQLRGYGGGNNVTRGTKSGAFSVMGDFPQVATINALRLEPGRFLNHFDITEQRKVAVIGSRVREVLFEPDEQPIGEDLEINGVYFKIIGVFHSLKSGEQADEDVQTVHVPFTTFQRAFNTGQRVGWFAISAVEGVPASEVEEEVLALLRSRHRVAPDDSRAFGHWNMEEEYLKVKGLFSGIRVLIWIVGVGTLAAGVVGVSNIMLVIVRERTREIGIRRAVGATPLAITVQIVLEAIILTAGAGYLGLLAGLGLMELANTMLTQSGAGTDMFLNPNVSLGDVLTALAVLVVCGVLAGLLPAQRAISMSAADALRAE